MKEFMNRIGRLLLLTVCLWLIVFGLSYVKPMPTARGQTLPSGHYYIITWYENQTQHQATVKEFTYVRDDAGVLIGDGSIDFINPEDNFLTRLTPPYKVIQVVLKGRLPR